MRILRLSQASPPHLLRLALLALLPAAWLAVDLTPADASPQPGPAILLHARSVTSKNACAWGTITDCSQAVVRGEVATSGVGPFYYVYLLAYRQSLVPNVAGMQCGISYQDGQAGDMLDGHGVEIYSWSLCATLEFITPGANAWPRPGGGNLITWDAVNRCQTGAMAVAGYFYTGAYDPDIFGVIRRPIDGLAKLADCTAIERTISPDHLGYVAFSSGMTIPGCYGCYGGCPSLPAPPPSTGPTALSLHLVRPPLPPPICTALSAISCDTVSANGRSSAGGEHYYAYLIASIGGMRGLGAINYGITYQGGNAGGLADGSGIDILSWGDCRGSQPAPPFTSPTWPAPGSGMRLYWAPETLCPDRGATIVTGYFYLSAYTPDELRLTPFPGDATASMEDCYRRVTTLGTRQLGRARFSPGGTLLGCRPCVENCENPTPVRSTTWSDIKSLVGGK